MNEALIEKIAESAELAVLPQAIPPEYRPLWRIAQIVLILDYCGRKGRCSRLQLCAISWGLHNSKTRDDLIALAEERYLAMNDYPLRFDPALVIAVNIAAAMQLIQKSGEEYFELTERGRSFSQRLRADTAIFSVDKITLARVGKSITQAALQRYVKDPRL